MSTFADKYYKGGGSSSTRGGSSFASLYQKDASGKAPLGAFRDAQARATAVREKQQKLQDSVNKAKAETEKYIQEYNDATSGFWGSINTRFGKTPPAPTLVGGYDSPALQQAVKTTQENAANAAKSFGRNLWEGTKNVLTSNTTESIYDIFYQRGLDTRSLDDIAENTKRILELKRRNDAEPDPRVQERRKMAIDVLMNNNIRLANETGGKIKDKTTKQLIFQSLGTALELAPPLGAGLTAEGRAIMALGQKELLTSLAKEGGLYGVGVGVGQEGQNPEATPESIIKAGATSGVFGVLTVILPGLTRYFAKYAAKEGQVILDKLLGRTAEKLTPVEEKLLQEAVQSVEQGGARTESRVAEEVAQATERMDVSDLAAGDNIRATFTDKTGTKEVTGTVEKVSVNAPKVLTSADLEAGAKLSTPVRQTVSIRQADGTIKRVSLAANDLELYRMEMTAPTVNPVVQETTQTVTKAAKPKTQKAKIEAQPSQKKAVPTVEEVKTFYRGGGEGAMPRNVTAKEVIRYERVELGNKDITIEPGVNLSSIPSSRLRWLTETPKAARAYGKATKDKGIYRIIARDSNGGVLVDTKPPVKTVNKTIKPAKPKAIGMKGPAKVTQVASRKKTVKEIQPVFGAEQGPTQSKPYKKLNKALREANIEANFGYQEKSLVAETKSAVEIIKKGADNAYRVALGYKNEPGVLNSATNIVMEGVNREKGKTDIANMLLVNRTRQATRNAKELSALRIAGESSANYYLRRLIASRMLRVANRSVTGIERLIQGGQKTTTEIFNEAVSAEAAKIEKFVKAKKMDMKAAQSVIDSLIC